MIILVTGSAGFIGSSLVERLLTTESPIHIVGLDNVNDYYDVSIKEYRLNRIEQIAARYPESTYTFIRGDLADKILINRLFNDYCFDVVVNLAAQAGVRYSIVNPDAYIESNLIGFTIFLKHAATVMIMGKMEYSIWCTLLPVLSMAVIPKSRIVPMTKWIILSVFMPLPRRVTN